MKTQSTPQNTVFEDYPLQVSSINRQGYIAANQSFFEKGVVYYVWIEADKIRLSTIQPKGVAEVYTSQVMHHGGSDQRGRGHYTMHLNEKLAALVGLERGAKVAIWQDRDGSLLLGKPTEEQIQQVGTRTHRKAVSGEVRKESKIFFTKEQKRFLNLSHYGDWFKLSCSTSLVGQARYSLSPITEKECEDLPAMKKVFRRPSYTCKVKYRDGFKLPEAFCRKYNIKEGDVVPMFFEGGELRLVPPERECSFCEEKTSYPKKVNICEECASVLPKAKEIMKKEER